MPPEVLQIMHANFDLEFNGVSGVTACAVHLICGDTHYFVCILYARNIRVGVCCVCN